MRGFIIFLVIAFVIIPLGIAAVGSFFFGQNFWVLLLIVLSAAAVAWSTPVIAGFRGSEVPPPHSSRKKERTKARTRN